ncbi:MAG: T9SS type A sorting domain-containing protein, partial [Paludibacteraceae bacterium]|nr:T9SS type A sorting domain-containing protein [Paludibacteraceae bacterium]
ITSALDNPDSDPLHWQLLGSDDAENWSILDERYYAEFSERSQTNSYTPKIAKTCKYFRLNVLATKNSADLQIAEWQLFGRYVDFFYEGESAIKVIGQQDIHIYPNPVKNKLTIENGVGMIKNVQIFDISGRKIANGKLSDGKSIDVSFLSAGMYILKIETETGIQTFKFNKIS